MKRKIIQTFKFPLFNEIQRLFLMILISAAIYATIKYSLEFNINIMFFLGFFIPEMFNIYKARKNHW